ncbi:hypothetical protein ZWY2020_059424 [Hordeum vulgare]|nr:hypothetical protein ZWY2020_059424 [Hordeum vulgare]
MVPEEHQSSDLSSPDTSQIYHAEQTDCEISFSSMLAEAEQVPRIVYESTSHAEAEAEAATGLDTNESTIESNISASDNPHHVTNNRGNDVVDKMDKGKSLEQLATEAKTMIAQQQNFDQFVEDWDAKWGSAGFGLFQYMTRDHVDHNRNLLFACYRCRSQILKEEDPFLTLTGPSRAIVCEKSVDFELQLKLRGRTESEDRALITGACTYNREDGIVCFTNCFCTVEFTMEVLRETVQATVLGVRVKDGSWPSGWGGRVACSVIHGEIIDATPREELELLVSRRRAMPVTSDGYLLLSRNVVSVDVNRRLNFLLEACLPSGDIIAQKELSFKPKLCNISQDTCELHGIELEITIAWSGLVSEKRDISVQGCVGDEEQMDWDIASMGQQVPRIDSKLIPEMGSEPETESSTVLDTSESANESSTFMFVPNKSILEPAGYDVEKMDRGKSDEQLKIEAKEMAAERKSFAMYVDAWEEWGNDGFGCFPDMTTVSSMQYTHLIPGSTPLHYGRVAPSLQIFSVKLIEIRGGLEWPLPVYGTVAARDHVDHNRNLLFARNRSECQILNEEDPFLTLTGPSRAIVSEESVVFEIQLKVRGRTKSRDKPLINGVCAYYSRRDGPICFTNCFCTIELSVEVLKKTVQATILGVRVKEEGSWPKGCGGRVACSVISPDTRPWEIELLGSRYTTMPMTSQGYLVLTRNIVSVDFCGSLNFVLEAYSDSGDKVAQQNVSFEPKFCNISQETCELSEGTELEITIAWSSLVSEKWDIWAQGCVF